MQQEKSGGRRRRLGKIAGPTSGTKQLMMQLLSLFEAGPLGSKFLEKFPIVWNSNHQFRVYYIK